MIVGTISGWADLELLRLNREGIFASSDLIDGEISVKKIEYISSAAPESLSSGFGGRDTTRSTYSLRSHTMVGATSKTCTQPSGKDLQCPCHYGWLKFH
jgi:hypothetical protein